MRTVSTVISFGVKAVDQTAGPRSSELSGSMIHEDDRLNLQSPVTVEDKLV